MFLKEELYKFYAFQLAIVLNYIHKSGFIFVDLKPENILIAEDGKQFRVDAPHQRLSSAQHAFSNVSFIFYYCVVVQWRE